MYINSWPRLKQNSNAPKSSLSVHGFTWINVKLAFHRLGDALQFDRLQRTVSLDHSRQACQRLPDKTGHLSHSEELQQLAINCWECPKEHRLGRRRWGLISHNWATSITTIVTQPKSQIWATNLKRAFWAFFLCSMHLWLNQNVI